MTQPISADVKERVVQQHITGLGRNVISKRTGISKGSVTNILKAWREHGNSGIRSQPFACPEEVVSKTTPKARPPSPDDSTGMGRLSSTTTTITSLNQ